MLVTFTSTSFSLGGNGRFGISWELGGLQASGGTVVDLGIIGLLPALPAVLLARFALGFDGSPILGFIIDAGAGRGGRAERFGGTVAFNTAGSAEIGGRAFSTALTCPWRVLSPRRRS